MMFRDVITLVSESPSAHGVLDDVTETQKQVYCSVRSVGMSEAYQAMSNGMHPQFVFVLSECADYNGEKIVGSVSFAEQLLKCNVAVIPGLAFGDDNSIRLAYAISCQDIEKGLKQIKAFIQSLK